MARDFNFSQTLRAATEGGAKPLAGTSVSHSGHMQLPPVQSGHSTVGLGYSVQSQPNLDNNTVDLDRERANFVDNSVRYEATLRFINGQAKGMLSAIQGQ
ncbi:Flagellar basal body rod protein FlgB [compost metagenome]